jgi:hypothetical protein
MIPKPASIFALFRPSGNEIEMRFDVAARTIQPIDDQRSAVDEVRAAALRDRARAHGNKGTGAGTGAVKQGR